MPLVETLTLLASLSSALQSLRAARTVDEKVEPKDGGSAGLLLGYEFVKSSQEWAQRANDAVEARLHGLLISSAVVAAIVTALAAGFVEGASARSPLLIVGLALLCFIALAASMARVLGRLALISAEAVLLRQASALEWEFMRSMLAEASQNERRNRRVIATKEQALGLLLLAFVAEVVLLSLWALSY